MSDLLIGFLGFAGFGAIGWCLANAFVERVHIQVVLPNAPQFSGRIPRLQREQLILAGLLLLSLVLMFFVDLVGGLFVLVFGFGFNYFFTHQRELLEKYQKNKKLSGLRELFPQALGMFIQALKTGQTVPQVLDYLSREAPSPLKEEFALVCVEMSLGLSAEAALTKMQERYPEFDEFRQFLESYKISGQTGANLTHLLQVLLEGMEEKGRLLRKMNAMTAQARLSGLVMGALPFLLGLVFFAMDPHLMTPLFTTKGGFLILFTAAIFETIGFLWIRQLLRLEV